MMYKKGMLAACGCLVSCVWWIINNCETLVNGNLTDNITYTLHKYY
jgi:hypothetical protein